MAEWLAVLVHLSCGLVAGTCFAATVMALDICSRSIHLLRAGNARLCTIAITLGVSVFTLSLFTQTGVRAPESAAWVALLLGGVYVGLLASALAELLDLLPVLMCRTRRSDAASIAALALALGKFAGAMLAAIWSVSR